MPLKVTQGWWAERRSPEVVCCDLSSSSSSSSWCDAAMISSWSVGADLCSRFVPHKGQTRACNAMLYNKAVHVCMLADAKQMSSFFVLISNSW